MVKPSGRIIVACAGSAAAVGLVLVMRPPTPAPGAAPAERSSSDRERAKVFFGTPQKYDMDNGQEMRPRW